MAEINIQRKKKRVSPWWLLLLVLALLALGAWYLLRADQNAASPEPVVPSTTQSSQTQVEAEADEPAAESAVEDIAAETSATPADFYAFVADDPAVPDYARRGLQLLTNVLVSLADRDDMRDPAVSERRDNLTSATSRLGEGGSLRPGFIAAAELMRTMQQQAYPNIEREAQALSSEAEQLSGRTGTPAEQQATQTFFQHAANVLRVLEKPAV